MKNAAFHDLLIRRRLASAGELERLDAQCGRDSFRVLLALVEKSPARRDRLAQSWGDACDVAYVDTGRTVVQPEALAMLAENAARELGVLPLYTREGVVTIATPHPEDESHLQTVENRVGGFVSPVFDLPDAIEAAQDIAYMSSSKLLQAVDAIDRTPAEPDALTPAPTGDRESVVVVFIDIDPNTDGSISQDQPHQRTRDTPKAPLLDGPSAGHLSATTGTTALMLTQDGARRKQPACAAIV